MGAADHKWRTKSSELSEAERKLMLALQGDWLVRATEQGQLLIPNAWEILALEVFVRGDVGPPVDALKRVVKNLRGGSIFRKTPEFDALCEF